MAISSLNFNGKIKIKLPEFSTSKIFHWGCSTLRKNALYDMIIGANLLSELGIEINFNTQQKEV
jgi:hypothetical protein